MDIKEQTTAKAGTGTIKVRVYVVADGDERPLDRAYVSLYAEPNLKSCDQFDAQEWQPGKKSRLVASLPTDKNGLRVFEGLGKPRSMW